MFLSAAPLAPRRSIRHLQGLRPMGSAIVSPDTTPLASVTTVPVEWLVPDHCNPRLTSVDGDTTDEEIIAQLYRAEDLGELLQSIAANGYMDIEPLIVLEHGGRLIVLEGNRRLAAIRLFREPDLVAGVSERSRVRIRLPDITDQYRRTLDRVSVYRVAAARTHAHSSVSSISTARRNGSLMQRPGSPPTGIVVVMFHLRTSLTASATSTTRSSAWSMRSTCWKQAQARAHLQHRRSGAARASISPHLYTALSRAPYMQFLGLDTAWSRYDPSPDPVPGDRVDRLSELLRWIYGSREDSVDPVVQSQIPTSSVWERYLQCRGTGGFESDRIALRCAREHTTGRSKVLGGIAWSEAGDSRSVQQPARIRRPGRIAGRNR